MKTGRYIELARARAGACIQGALAGADLEATLLEVDPRFTKLLDALGREVGLGGAELERRVTAALFEFAAIQLADDLADGDCGYLRPAIEVGPGAQWLLQHLFHAVLLETGVSREDLRAALADLLVVGSAQQDEVRGGPWTLERASTAATGLNGHQYAAYFRLLFAGTSRAPIAVPLGHAFGFAMHVVTDRVSRDARWMGLEARERGALRDEALAAVEKARTHGLRALTEPLRWFEAVLTHPLGVGGR